MAQQNTRRPTIDFDDNYSEEPGTPREPSGSFSAAYARSPSRQSDAASDAGSDAGSARGSKRPLDDAAAPEPKALKKDRLNIPTLDSSNSETPGPRAEVRTDD